MRTYLSEAGGAALCDLVRPLSNVRMADEQALFISACELFAFFLVRLLAVLTIIRSGQRSRTQAPLVLLGAHVLYSPLILT